MDAYRLLVLWLELGLFKLHYALPSLSLKYRLCVKPIELATPVISLLGLELTKPSTLTKTHKHEHKPKH
jgi:hypothetical protein